MSSFFVFPLCLCCALEAHQCSVPVGLLGIETQGWHAGGLVSAGALLMFLCKERGVEGPPGCLVSVTWFLR